MKITFTNLPKDFSQLTESLLMKKEACNNLMLGLINRMLESQSLSNEFYLGYVEEDGEVIFAFMQTPPNNWILADVDQLDNQTIRSVAKFITFREHL